MTDMVNLTVRVNARLKSDADVACEYLNRSVSELVRAALRQVIDEYRKTHKQDADYARHILDSQAAIDLVNQLKPFLKKYPNQGLESNE